MEKRKRVCKWTRRNERRAEALARRAARDLRSPTEQLLALDWRLGFDQGAKRERGRLRKANAA